MVPSIVAAIEFGYPKRSRVLDDSFRTGAAHRGAYRRQVLDLDGIGAVRNFLFVMDRVDKREELFQVAKPVEFPFQDGRFGVFSETERSGAVVGRAKQIVDLGEQRQSCMLFDDASSPVIRSGIPQRSEQAIQRLYGIWGGGGLVRIWYDRWCRDPVRLTAGG